MVENSNLGTFLKNTFLFSGLNVDEISRLVDTYPAEIISYKRGEKIYSSLTDARKVGIVLDGKCEVRREKNDGSRVVLNTLGRSESFGILSVLTSDEFPTSIIALKNTQVLYFTSEQIDYFVNNSSQISRNIIKFLANRVVFLNKKIATFSGTRVEDRLAAFILCERAIKCCDEFSFNCQKTSEEINAGRASVYRALESLQKMDLIKFDHKKIYIIDLLGLERIAK